MSRVFPLSPSINQKVTVGSKEFEWNGNFWKRVRITESDITTSANSALTDANFYTDTAIANLVDTAPSTLNTLNELASALGDDPNFATTITNQIAGKANNSHTHAISDVTSLQNELDDKANLSGAIFTGPLSIKTTEQQHKIEIYQENDTNSIADTFSGTTDKNYIYFTQASGSNDPGYIMHETQTSPDSNEGVLHLAPSDDNSLNDYVSIHGTNDPDAIRIHTNGLVESAGSVQLKLGSGSGLINMLNEVSVGSANLSDSRARNITISASSPSGGNIGDIWIQV